MIKPLITQLSVMTILVLSGCTFSFVPLTQTTTTSFDPVTMGSNSVISTSVDYTITNNFTAVYEAVNPSVAVVYVYTDTNSLFGQGSGFIYEKVDNTYYVVTNRSNIVGTNMHYELLFGNDYRFSASLVGDYAPYDISVLTFTSNLEFVVPTHGSMTPLKVGAGVMAIGTPKFVDELRNTFTRGVISGFDRQVQSSDEIIDYPAFQIDAPFNEGSYGGPVINNQGEIIGVLGLKVTETTDSIESIGLALSLDDLQTILYDIIHKPTHSYSRPRMGLLVMDIRLFDLATRTEKGIPNDIYMGLYVDSVAPGSAAALAGLPAASIILAIDGQPTLTMSNISSLLYRKRVGDTIVVTVNGGQTYTLTLQGVA